MPYLVDANILCESSKSQPEPVVLQWLAAQGIQPEAVAGIAHRIVHGGTRYTEPTVLDEPACAYLSGLGPLQHIRGAGLLALDLLPPARHFVAKRMMFGARAWP